MAFLWGNGGQRLTPQEIAAQRQRSQAMLANGMDTSPVGHWTQGLARVAQAAFGGLQDRRLDQASDANRAESGDIAQLLVGGGGKDAVAAALVNPYISDEVRGLAEAQFKRMNPAPQQPTEFERMLANANILPGTPEYVEANRRAAQGKYDPLISATLPGDRFYSGPQSGLAEVFSGGQTAAVSAPRIAPPKEAVLDLLQNPGTAQQFDEIFGAGTAAQVFAAREGFRETTGR